jgi:hypothetical protein
MKKIKIRDSDLHPHLIARMHQRGITKEEIVRTLNEGWEAEDTKSGTFGKIYVFSYRNYWEGKYFEEKEVTVYFKYVNNELILLTVKGRYGNNFPRKREKEIK